MKNQFDLTSAIANYEAGLLENNEMLVLFSYLVKTGIAWQLQGSYVRTAKAFIERGYLAKNGKIINEPND